MKVISETRTKFDIYVFIIGAKIPKGLNYLK